MQTVNVALRVFKRASAACDGLCEVALPVERALHRRQCLVQARLVAVNDESGLYQTLSAMECTLYWKGDLTQAIACCRCALEHAQGDVHRLHTLLSMCAISRD